MTGSNDLKPFNVFAAEAEEFYDEDFQTNSIYPKGHEPLQSLPATFYNSLMHDLTEQAQATKNVVDSIYEELKSVIVAGGLTLSATDTDQLLNAIKEVTKLQIATGTLLGGIFSSDRDWHILVNADGTAKVNTVAATTTNFGIVQLNDTVTSEDTTQAATANVAKALYDAVQKCFVDVSISGSKITFTKGNGDTKDVTVPTTVATRATYAKYLVNSDSPSGSNYVTADTSKNLSAHTLTLS